MKSCRRVAFALFALMLGACRVTVSQPALAQPYILSPDQAAALIAKLPEYPHFGYSGLAYSEDNLYAGTNIGLLEVEGSKLKRLIRAENTYSVTSGPWLGAANHLLWMMDEDTHELLNYNGKQWRRMPLPQPEKGYYSRGDTLEGVKPTGNNYGFWMVAGGSAWRWDPSQQKWKPERAPVHKVGKDGLDNLIGVLPIGQTPFFLVRHDVLTVLKGHSFRSDTVMIFQDGCVATFEGAGW